MKIWGLLIISDEKKAPCGMLENYLLGIIFQCEYL